MQPEQEIKQKARPPVTQGAFKFSIMVLSPQRPQNRVIARSEVTRQCIPRSLRNRTAQPLLHSSIQHCPLLILLGSNTAQMQINRVSRYT